MHDSQPGRSQARRDRRHARRAEGRGSNQTQPGKKTYPLEKQIYRQVDATNRFVGDDVTKADEIAEGEPFLVPVGDRG